jgi:hypothetical protein
MLLQADGHIQLWRWDVSRLTNSSKWIYLNADSFVMLESGGLGW